MRRDDWGRGGGSAGAEYSGGVLYMKYEEAIAKLEQIARQLEQNQLPIDQIAAQLREAQELVKYCREQLTSVDEEIKKIVGEETAE